MPTQEERITRLEQITSEYRPLLTGIAHELTIVKGLIVDQVHINNKMQQDISELRQDMTGVKQDISGLKQASHDTKVRLSTIEEQLRQVLMLLRPS